MSTHMSMHTSTRVSFHMSVHMCLAYVIMVLCSYDHIVMAYTD